MSFKISEIFKPKDYTKVDGIVDIVFAAADDQQFSRDLETESEESQESTLTKHEIYARKRQSIATSLTKHLGDVPPLIRRKTALFSDGTGNFRIAISLSKRYERKDQQYWYAYLEPMRNFLRPAQNGYMVYGFLDKDFALAVPFSIVEKYRQGMGTTPAKENRSEYWHVSMREDQGSVIPALPKFEDTVSLDDYRFTVG